MAAHGKKPLKPNPKPFQHTATRRWLPSNRFPQDRRGVVSTHSHPKVAAAPCFAFLQGFVVSTHSHPKVAALFCMPQTPRLMFQHTATRRWLREFAVVGKIAQLVSTHSHPKVAAASAWLCRAKSYVSTHSHPKVAAQGLLKQADKLNVSTHSHPKVAAGYAG